MVRDTLHWHPVPRTPPCLLHDSPFTLKGSFAPVRTHVSIPCGTSERWERAGVENWIGKIAWKEEAGLLKVFLLVSIYLIFIFILSFQRERCGAYERIGRSIGRRINYWYFSVVYFWNRIICIAGNRIERIYKIFLSIIFLRYICRT